MSERRRLNTWGEIAEYFDCDIRTAQRWSKTRSLPIYRLPGGGRTSVFAYEDELSAWLHARPKPEEPPEPAVVESSPAPPVAATLPPSRRILSRRGALITLGAGLPVAATAAAFFILRKPPLPARAVISGNTLTVLDGTGTTIWTDRYSLPLREMDWAVPWPARVIDLEGSGEAGVLVVCNYVGDASNGGVSKCEIRYYGPGGGTPRWSCAVTPPGILDHQGKPYQNNWSCRHLITTPAASGKGNRIWAAVHHGWRSAGFVLQIDSAGKSQVQVAHTGHIYWLCPFSDRIAFGVVNNAVDLAGAGVFGVNDPGSTSPAVGRPDYMYAQSPTGSLRAYALFPTADISIAAGGPYGATGVISPLGDGLLLEVDGYMQARLHYEFSNQFEPIQVADSGGYPMVHQQFEKEGKLDHSFADCPIFRAAVRVRRWDPVTGWQDRDVKWNPGSHSLVHVGAPPKGK